MCSQQIGETRARAPSMKAFHLWSQNSKQSDKQSALSERWALRWGARECQATDVVLLWSCLATYVCFGLCHVVPFEWANTHANAFLDWQGNGGNIRGVMWLQQQIALLQGVSKATHQQYGCYPKEWQYTDSVKLLLVVWAEVFFFFCYYTLHAPF